MDDTNKPDEMQDPVDPGGYILPDGKYLTADQLEERLKVEAASGKSPKESEEAKYKLANFYLGERKPLLAYPIFKAVREAVHRGTLQDPLPRRFLVPGSDARRDHEEVPSRLHRRDPRHGAGLRGGPGVRPEDLVGRAEHLVPGQAAGPGDGRVRHGGRQLLRAEEHFSAPGDSAEREGREDRRLV